MNLKYIKTEKCPYCGCEEIVEEAISSYDRKINYHINGERGEIRRFACGYAIEYSPNFRKERLRMRCEYEKDEEKKEFNEMLQKTIEFVKNLPGDPIIQDEIIKERLREKVF